MTTTQIKRQPKGIPTGGEFATHDRTEGTVSLGKPSAAERALAGEPGTMASVVEYWEAMDAAQAEIDAPAPAGLTPDQLQGWTSIGRIDILATQQGLSYLAYQYGRNAELAENKLIGIEMGGDGIGSPAFEVWEARRARLRELERTLLDRDADIEAALDARDPERVARREADRAEVASRQGTLTKTELAGHDASEAMILDFYRGAEIGDEPHPKSPAELKSALQDKSGRKAKGEVRQITISEAACPQRGWSEFEVDAPADGTLMSIYIHSGLPRLKVNSGRVLIFANNRYGNSIDITGDAEVMVVSDGAKVTVTHAGSKPLQVIHRFGEREPGIYTKPGSEATLHHERGYVPVGER